MSQLKKLMMLVAGFALLLSCAKEEVIIDTNQNDVEASFRTTINTPGTRATGTTWEANDAIGIYALKQGTTLANENVYDGKANVEYKNSTAGAMADFTAVSSPILFPGDGTMLDFVAYYPYTTGVTADYVLPIDVTVQSPLSAIDVLYATANDQSMLNPAVALAFTHKLSQVVINLTAETELSLEGVALTIENALVEGTMNLSDGTVTAGIATATITPELTSSASSATATAILLPGQAMSDLKVNIELTDGTAYTWTPTTYTLTSNTKNIYTLNLTSGSVEMVGDGSSIEDWGDGQTGDPEDLNPNGGETGTGVEIEVTAPNINAEGGTTTLQITVPEGTAWTASTDADWITLGTPVAVTRSTQTSTGSSDIEVTVAENETTEVRTGTITVTVEETPYTATITQAAAEGGDPEPANLLFAGGDFEDWTAFTATLNNHGLKSYALQVDGGRNSSKAMSLVGNNLTTSNDYVFTNVVPQTGSPLIGKSHIVFYIKGTSGKSLSLNVYKEGGGYHVFNLKNYSSEGVISTASQNDYVGDIDTGGDWMKVTLDISSLTDLATSADSDLFAVKVGRDAVYNLLLDDFTVE